MSLLPLPAPPQSAWFRVKTGILSSSYSKNSFRSYKGADEENPRKARELASFERRPETKNSSRDVASLLRCRFFSRFFSLYSSRTPRAQAVALTAHDEAPIGFVPRTGAALVPCLLLLLLFLGRSTEQQQQQQQKQKCPPPLLRLAARGALAPRGPLPPSARSASPRHLEAEAY